MWGVGYPIHQSIIQQHPHIHNPQGVINLEVNRVEGSFFPCQLYHQYITGTSVVLN